MSQPPSNFVFTLPPPGDTTPARGGNLLNKGAWFMGLALLANAAAMLYTHATGNFPDIVLDRTAMAQVPAPPPSGQLLGARGIYMMPAQLGPQTYGLYLLDVDSGTICVYRASPESSHFRLMAARSFKYDRFLEDFNNEPLRPKDVQKLVEDQRQRQELRLKDDLPTVDQNPKPDPNLPDLPR